MNLLPFFSFFFMFFSSSFRMDQTTHYQQHSPTSTKPYPVFLNTLQLMFTLFSCWRCTPPPPPCSLFNTHSPLHHFLFLSSSFLQPLFSGCCVFWCSESEPPSPGHHPHIHTHFPNTHTFLHHHNFIIFSDSMWLYVHPINHRQYNIVIHLFPFSWHTSSSHQLPPFPPFFTLPLRKEGTKTKSLFSLKGTHN